MKLNNIHLHFLILFIYLHPPAQAQSVLNNEVLVSGVDQTDYVNMWWQWAVSMPNEQSPVRDQTGSFCAVNQIGPVWFLAGGYGSSKITRKCSVPANKYIFFPVINMLYYPQHTPSKMSCETAQQGAAINNNNLSSFSVNIDDEQYVNPVFFRKQSAHCFDLAARKTNNPNRIEVYPSATDGYWVMLKPLAIGHHHIKFHGEYNHPNTAYGTMVQDIEYQLEVVPTSNNP